MSSLEMGNEEVHVTHTLSLNRDLRRGPGLPSLANKAANNTFVVNLEHKQEILLKFEFYHDQMPCQ